MNRTFLYKLSRHSKPAFILLGIYIVLYATCFYKKMDMVLFPYNAMFAMKNEQRSGINVYGLKAGGKLIKISHFPYWKKDFLEESIGNFARYKLHGDSLVFENFVRSRIRSTETQETLLKRLRPSKENMDHWPAWCLEYAGADSSFHEIELMRYGLEMKNGRYVVRDSLLVSKFRYP